jgi:hypothetical protein
MMFTSHSRIKYDRHGSGAHWRPRCLKRQAALAPLKNLEPNVRLRPKADIGDPADWSAGEHTSETILRGLFRGPSSTLFSRAQSLVNVRSEMAQFCGSQLPNLEQRLGSGSSYWPEGALSRLGGRVTSLRAGTSGPES